MRKFAEHGPPVVASELRAGSLASRRPTIIKCAIYRETRAFFIMQRCSGPGSKLRPPTGTLLTKAPLNFSNQKKRRGADKQRRKLTAGAGKGRREVRNQSFPNGREKDRAAALLMQL